MSTPDFVEGHYDTGFIAKHGEELTKKDPESGTKQNIAIVAAYIDYLMNLEENKTVVSADATATSRWREFGLHKGVLRI